MKDLTLLFVCILSISIAGAQKLTVPDLIKLRHMKVEQIESFIKEKGYSIVDDTKDKDYRVTMYNAVATEDEASVLRAVCISQDFGARMVEIEYGVWDKKEADLLVSWLLKNGFKMIRNLKVNEEELVKTYSRQGKSIQVTETVQKGETITATLYKIGINSIDY